jgi:hypothetical protein
MAACATGQRPVLNCDTRSQAGEAVRLFSRFSNSLRIQAQAKTEAETQLKVGVLQQMSV